MAYSVPAAVEDDNVTYESLVEEISNFLQANRDISQIRFQCLVHEAFQPSCNSTSTQKNDRRTNVVSGAVSKAHVARKRQSSNRTRWICFSAFTFMAVILAYLVSSQAQHLAVTNRLTKTVHTVVAGVVPSSSPFPPLMDIAYHLVLRPARLLSTSLGLATNKDLQECYVKNPLLTLWKQDSPKEECTCSRVKYILSAKEDLGRDHNLPLTPYLIDAQPIVLRQWSGHASVTDLRRELVEFSGILGAVPSVVSCNLDVVSNLQDLTKPQIFDAVVNNPTAHLEWLTRNYIGCSAIKRLFPLPVVWQHGFFDSHRVLLLDGAESNAYELPIGSEVTIYLQGHGARKVILMPKEPCSSRCRHLSTRLKSGDILMFSGSVWRARSERVDGEPSLASLAVLDEEDSE
ncbi:uncharacterized protein LOC101855874 [Aplysia californica]|uniref:Uncharacterized protein LOC101855874 n=1 Tax=Aplysia californica TaxID=6500 RepID=A0ABM0JRP7_APLCA|nr:uncharacterized protein LOC101855874 [Aplysia californica]XP_035826074.1 uncharacterized protein LOC101855874 [Aplysia californica]